MINYEKILTDIMDTVDVTKYGNTYEDAESFSEICSILKAAGIAREPRELSVVMAEARERNYKGEEQQSLT